MSPVVDTTITVNCETAYSENMEQLGEQIAKLAMTLSKLCGEKVTVQINIS